MFLTQTSDRDDVGSMLNGPGYNMWHQVGLAINAPFFLAEFGVKSDEIIISDGHIFSSINQLKIMTTKSNDMIDSMRVELISPGWLNKSQDGGWQMDTIIAVWRGDGTSEAGRFKVVADRYVLADGRVFEKSVESDGELNWTCIWKMDEFPSTKP